MVKSKRFLATALAILAVGSSAMAAPPEGRPLKIKQAGQLYGSVCQNAYPNVKTAIATVEANGFALDQSTGLYTHPKLAMHFRINKSACNAQFEARKGRDKLPGAEFAEWSTKMIQPGAKPGSPEIKSARLGSNRFGVTVIRKK